MLAIQHGFFNFELACFQAISFYSTFKMKYCEVIFDLALEIFLVSR